MTDSEQDLPSRREFAKKAATCLLGTVIGVQLGPQLAAAEGKISKAQAKYQDHPHGRERCEKCDNFLDPDRCKAVEGTVSPQGWCKRYL
jgi:hypothetical protein